MARLGRRERHEKRQRLEAMARLRLIRQEQAKVEQARTIFLRDALSRSQFTQLTASPKLVRFSSGATFGKFDPEVVGGMTHKRIQIGGHGKVKFKQHRLARFSEPVPQGELPQRMLDGQVVQGERALQDQAQSKIVAIALYELEKRDARLPDDIWGVRCCEILAQFIRARRPKARRKRTKAK